MACSRDNIKLDFCPSPCLHVQPHAGGFRLWHTFHPSGNAVLPRPLRQSGTRRHTAGYRQYKSPHGHHDELLYRVPPDLSLHGHTVYRLCHRRRTRLSAGLAIVQHPSVYLLPSHEAGNVSAVKTAPDASVFAMASGVSRFPFFSHITNTFINAPP